MGGKRTCPKGCPLAKWASLSPADRKSQRKTIAEQLYKQGFTQEVIAQQLNVDQRTISRDLESLDMMPKPLRPKGGRPKASKKNNGTGRPTGRPRTDAYYSMKTANRLRGKERHAFMEEWAIRREEQFREQNPDLKWLHSLDETLRRFIALDKELKEGSNWQKYEITPCTFGLLPKCVEIMNQWLSMFQQQKPEDSKNVVHH
jgi:predicted ArsR family transcriptional regulator